MSVKDVVALIVGVTLALLVLVGLAAALAFRFCRKRPFLPFLRSRSIRLNSDSGHPPQLVKNDVGSRSITIEDTRVKKWSLRVLRAATNSFDEAYVIGRGNYATVYKAELDGVDMAIKRVVERNQRVRTRDRVRTEVEVIGTIHNRNILDLKGYCLDGKECLLLYEFMENGSLEDHLFGEKTPLKWAQIEKILMGTAKGIAYLHEGCNQQIIHRDIKPANILLDKNLEPRVADFGLLRTTDVSDTHVSTRVAGTVGYVAPEYVQTYKLATHSDTYSFGIVILVVLGQRKPMKTSNGYVERIADVAYKALKDDKLESLVVPHLIDETNRTQVMRFIHVALLCIQPTFKERPSMGFVAQMLLGNAEPPRLDVASFFLVPSFVSFTPGDQGGNISETGTQSSLEDFERRRTTYHFYRQ